MSRSRAPRLQDLAAGWQLDGDQLARLELLVATVRDVPEAPTAIRTTEAIIRDHLADSLVALSLPEVSAASRLADIGSGPGFPGLALAVALPRCVVHLVEANRRKCAFLEVAARECGAHNATVVCARVEEWDAGATNQDVVTARALAPPDVVAEYAAPLLRVGGVLVAWRGRRDPREDAALARAAAQLGLVAEEPLPVTPYPGVEHRHLHLLRKVEETPSAFPRRPGLARKRPLGGGAAPRAIRT